MQEWDIAVGNCLTPLAVSKSDVNIWAYKKDWSKTLHMNNVHAHPKYWKVAIHEISQDVHVFVH